MAQLGFDTLAFVKRLAAAGMDSRHAEALAEALAAEAFGELATKADLRELELRLRNDMKDLEIRLTNGLTARMGAMIVASTAILGVLVTLS